LSKFPKGVSFAVVKDITVPGAYDQVLQDAGQIKSVIHSASPFLYGHSNAESEILSPAIRGTVELLTSIYKYAPSVQRVVLTSSLAAVVGDPTAQGSFSEAHWNPISYEQALQPELTYIGSKALAEKAAWKFVSTTPNVKFSLVSINPGLIFGPPLHGMGTDQAINTSNYVIDGLIRGLYVDGMPATDVPCWVDVRDVANAHIKALRVKSGAYERFLLCAGAYTYDKIVLIMWDKFPNLRACLPQADDSLKTALDPLLHFENSKSVHLLGVEYRSLEESVSSTVLSLV
jgi:nucleoside-diphosphate-sugar epimerase